MWAAAIRALPSAVLGPDPRPPWNWHFWVLLAFSAGRPHCSPVLLLRAVQRGHWILPPAVKRLFSIIIFYKSLINFAPHDFLQTPPVSKTGHRTRKTRFIGSIGSHQAILGGTPWVGGLVSRNRQGGGGVPLTEHVKAAGKAHGGCTGVVGL